MIVILHAFSRKNAGDGLLVDLTLRVLEQAGVPGPYRVLALDPSSFPELTDVRRVPGEPRARPSPALVGATLEVLRSAGSEVVPGPHGVVERLLKDARGIIAVGGGYLVADSVVRQGGVLLNHLAQILAAGRSKAPSIYLPQSIGPLQGPIGALTRAALSRVDVLYARDDETFAELRGLTEVRRCPDLAVLRLAEELERITRPTGHPAAANRGPTLLVPRELPHAPGYHDRLRALGRAVTPLTSTPPVWTVQADVDGPRSDRRFLQTLGVSDGGNLGDRLRSDHPGVVVSVRLHGAIASLLAGWPAIHLSYERKGWGAYQDLGLDEWVHDARSFDVEKVRDQAAALHADPSPLFDRIEARLPALLESHRALIADVAARFGGRA